MVQSYKELEKLLADTVSRRKSTWDALFESKSIGRIAVAVGPNKERVELERDMCAKLLQKEESNKAGYCTPEWQEALISQIARLTAELQLPGDWFPAIGIPRFVHGQSQGICDVFGAKVEKQADGNYFVHPIDPQPEKVRSIEIKPLETSMYWGIIKWIKYARRATKGIIAFRNPVITSPLDTANYLLGTTKLMEWIYTEPETLTQLLQQITGVIIRMIKAIRSEAGGTLHGDCLSCMRNVFCLCSECRSLLSAEIYEQFEAPYLREIGEHLGAYGIHSCGSWERTIPSALRDPNLRVMNGQIRENDLALLCKMADGKVVLSIGQSRKLDERYTWKNRESFFRYLLETVPDSQPLEIGITEDEIQLWNSLHQSIRGCESSLR